MKRGALSNSVIPTLWVHGPTVFSKKSVRTLLMRKRDLWYLSPADQNWILRAGFRANVELVWVGKIPKQIDKDFGDLFQSSIQFDSYDDLYRNLKIREWVVEMVVGDESIKGDKIGFIGDIESYKRRASDDRRYRKEW